ncbi:MAG: hypothetical protein RL020_722 [Pseudomonadota bacterium]|jgi:hypothetical protein
MARYLATLLLCSFFVTSAFGKTDAPAYTSKRISNPEDIQAIKQVIEDFRLAIINKDGKKLSTLVLNSRILFTSPGDQKAVEKIREKDINFDGVGIGGFYNFSNFISTAPDKIEEKFYNVDITQDGILAWVMFDYEFYENDKVSNYGVEHWQMRKIDGKWKIFSVIWSQYLLERK